MAITVRRPHIALYRQPSPSLAAHAAGIGFESLISELGGNARTEEEIRAARNPDATRQMERRMQRLARAGTFAGVVLFSQTGDTSRAIGCAWGVASRRPGIGGSVRTYSLSRNITEAVRVQQLDLRTGYHGSGLDALLLDTLLERYKEAGTPRVGVSVPEEAASSCQRYREMGFLTCGTSTQDNYFGRGAAARIVHMEADIAPFRQTLASQLPASAPRATSQIVA